MHFNSSNINFVCAAADADDGGRASNGGRGGGGGQRRNPDHYMPIGNVTRIMRRVLPDHAKVADDAKEAMQECVAEFITHLTRAANDLCHRDYRRTITPEDAVAAMAALGFHDYVGPLTAYINNHRAAAAQDHHPYYPPPMTPPTVAPPSPPPPYQLPPSPPPPYQLPPMTPPSSPVGGGYVPSPPEELPTVRDYFAAGYGGGEGYSGEDDFDPFE